MSSSDTPIDLNITQATVMGRKVATIGSRVKHYCQRYGGTATATVVGFYYDPEASEKWIKVRVKPDWANDQYGNTWDWDRTVIAPDINGL